MTLTACSRSRRLFAALAVLGAALAPSGLGCTLAVSPAKLEFPLHGARFAVTCTEEVQITSIRVLSLTDGLTGRPLAVECARQAISLRPSNVTDKIVEVDVTIDETMLSASPFFDGSMTVVFDTPVQKQNAAPLTFQIVRNGFNPLLDKPDQATLTLQDSSVKVAMVQGQTFPVCVNAEKWGIVIDRVIVSRVLDASGNELLNAIQPPAGPVTVPANRQVCLDVKWNIAPPVWAVKADAKLKIEYHADLPGSPQKSLAVTLDCQRPAIDVRAGDNGEFRIRVIRTRPWAGTWDALQTVAYSATPSGAQLPLANLRAELFSGLVQPLLVEGAQLRAEVLANSQILYTATIPRGETLLRGSVYFDQLLGTDRAFHPIFLVKDAWRCRAAAVLAAYGFAWLIFFLTGRFRTRILHDGTRRNLAAQLAQFLTARPDLTGDSSVGFIRELLSDSVAFDRADEAALATENLQSAAARLQTLMASPPAAPQPLASGTPSIRIAQPTANQCVGRRLTLLIDDPSGIAPDATVTWSIENQAGSQIWTTFGPHRTRVAFRFSFAETYTVKVTAPGLLITRQVSIAAESPKKMFSALTAIDILTGVTAFVLAGFLAYLMTNSADSWGSGSDYAGLFAGAFGVTAGTQSIRLVTGAIRGGN